MNDREREREAPRDEAEIRIRQMSRRSFLWAGAAAVGVLGVRRWINTRREEDGVPWPFRRAFEINEDVARDVYRPDHLAPVFARERRQEPFVNGDEGMQEPVFDPATWELQVEGVYHPSDQDGPGDPLHLTIKEIRALAAEVGLTEMVTEFKCVEGWSRVVHWGGVRFSDFLRKYPPQTLSGHAPDLDRHPEDLSPYIALETPDNGYYVGLEMESALHPQTLLCTEMNGAPLTLDHGAPLRLVMPLKYGIKQIKRIGAIRYVTHKPPDFWAEQGYDYYAGH